MLEIAVVAASNKGWVHSIFGWVNVKFAVPDEVAALDKTNWFSFVTEETIVPDGIPAPTTAQSLDTTAKLANVVRFRLPETLVLDIGIESGEAL